MSHMRHNNQDRENRKLRWIYWCVSCIKSRSHTSTNIIILSGVFVLRTWALSRGSRTILVLSGGIGAARIMIGIVSPTSNHLAKLFCSIMVPQYQVYRLVFNFPRSIFESEWTIFCLLSFV